MTPLNDPQPTISSSKSPVTGQLAAGALFLLGALLLAALSPTIEIAWVGAILMLTIYLFAFEVVAVDVAAASIMVLLGLSSLLAPFMGLEQGLVDNRHLFDGFSSNAVISIIAVMIIGAGLDRTGIMNSVASFILKVGGTTEGRIIPVISATVGFISSFMQNVGAAALFLPVVSRISARAGLPMSRLLMPMGFTAILGGTMTMVGSSPLILLNDLILTSNRALPADQQMATWGLFSVTPIGIALIAAGIIYFVLAGRFVLPKTKSESSTSGTDPMQYFQDVYGLRYKLSEVVITDESGLIGKQLDDIETAYRVRVIATKLSGEANRIGPGALARDVDLEAGMVLGVVADPDSLTHFIEVFKLKGRPRLRTFANDLATSKAGIAEVVIPPGSSLIGKSARDVWMRKTYGLAMIGLHRNGETMREGEDIRNMPFIAGDTLVVHTPWDVLPRIEKDKNFVVVTTEYPHEELRPHKVGWAVLFFAIALAMVLFSDIRLSVALLTGAMGMVLSGVLNIEEAYEAVSWKTVFLLASLIPLGLAVETTGTAKWIAEQVLWVVGDMPIWVIQLAVALLATFFTLVMSNVGATVLLVPLAVNIAIGAGANPAVFALTVAIATSNSFLIPTHQVNALIMGPAGYRVSDFMRAGGIMTLIFLVVMTLVMNLLF
ncbi:MAG: SLC13 family permease [Candidatus Thiodiazotropha sp.]|nr:SLC13 family permease [Candidatus Thiodiazotropha taylori]MBT3057667.1 SLC13 family permease [Candidatus Thiodiazotropha sp. (ex Lucina pensylvanica)]MBT3062573.1 SLC13 family permease [Candidatus Thiodiazotropha sp. (ex Lucina pensylvanica)]MBV2093976.1 SLC13 family permease [Candidatus Thiodiazotropha sp. (ex Codakia orbicularis)]PUB74947.1 MAG: SLC13 family permease [gamma proteobacterium symbiont of Ctena orbiculata]